MTAVGRFEHYGVIRPGRGIPAQVAADNDDGSLPREVLDGGQHGLDPGVIGDAPMLRQGNIEIRSQ